jgi:phage major head subunit gpT-like protein
MGAKGLSSRAIIGAYYDRLEANTGSAWVDAVSMLFQSDQESETYKWLGMAPAMREWVGGRQSKGFQENGITIKNRKFEATLEVLVDDLRRDKTGQLMVRINEMADRTNSHWASLLSTLVLNGLSTNCYDGQFYFDVDHVEGNSGVQSNAITLSIAGTAAQVKGTPTAPGVEIMSKGILASVKQILGFKDDQGEPLNEGASSFLIMSPIQLMDDAIAAVKNPFYAAGVTNTVQNTGFSLNVVANPRLSWSDRIAVFRTDGAAKPFIRQQEEDVTLKAIAEGSELEVLEDKHLYGVKAMRNVGYGYWQHACTLQFVS